MLKKFLNLLICSLIFSGTISLSPSSYAGQRHIKMQIKDDDEAEKNTTSLPRFFSYEISPALPFEVSSKVWPDDILFRIFHYVESKDFQSTRRVCKHWHSYGYNVLVSGLPTLESEYKNAVASMPLQALSTRDNSSNSSQISIPSNLQNSINQFRIFPECHQALCAMYANIDPCEDCDSIKAAVPVIQSIPNIQNLLNDKLYYFNIQFKEAFSTKLLTKKTNKKNLKMFTKQPPQFHLLLKKSFMGLYLLSKVGDEAANKARLVWYTILSRSLNHFNEGLNKEGEVNVKKMSDLLEKKGHLLTPPFWTAYLTSEDKLPLQQLRLYLAIINSSLVNCLDPSAINPYLVFFYKNFPQAAYKLQAPIAKAHFQMSQLLKHPQNNPEEKDKKSKKKK